MTPDHPVPLLVVPTVELRVRSSASSDRRREPVTCGVPWPRGVLHDPSVLGLWDERGQAVSLQTRVLNCWPDGSVRWLLLDWQATVNGSTHYTLGLAAAETTVPASPLHVTESDGRLTIDTGPAQFQIQVGTIFPFTSVTQGGAAVIDPTQSSFTAEDEAGRIYRPRLNQLELEESGPVRVALRVEGELVHPGVEPLAYFRAWLHFFAGSSTVRFVITMGNPRRASHPGGFWCLGDKGSVYLRDAALRIALPEGGEPTVVRCSAEPRHAAEPLGLPLEVYQDSSGGENWNSSIHINRNHVVPSTFRGYRLQAGTTAHTGLRATPIVTLTRGNRLLGIAMQYFWQNFPKAVEAMADTLTLRLFPRQHADVHELQGGEQKTHTFYVAFGPDAVTNDLLAWAREPLLPHAAPEWYCQTGVIPYLTPRSEDPNSDYLHLVDAAIEGDDTFEHKRERIDEYGWRHFGDIYGDHEAVFHKGPTPLVSHYNNQYDPIAGFAYQFLRSADARWWRHMDELAWHVIDIDIYHTDRDKAVYNHGLFWHTYHYVDADTATHRSYPRVAKVNGGGPGNEQNYAAGLVLHYFLTGNAASRETATALARRVLAMDDGRNTVFRWLDRGYTGLASASRTPLYHGPGRGSANSIAVLLDGHLLTGDPVFLEKAEQLLRRCIHPNDDIPARNLLDAENRWFYTMFLQSLGRYLDHKAELGQLDFMYAYARASLLHYARWMADHEYPYLDKPEILEYPTETWVAQDMRKSDIFKYAAKHATGAERDLFLERSEFFFRYVTTRLPTMPTRTLCRPVVLLLSNGLMHAYFQKHLGEAAPAGPRPEQDFGRPEVFVPQKVRAKKRLVFIAVLCAVLGLCGLVFAVLSLAG